MGDEMRRALEADNKKLRQLTGEDHGPIFLDDAHSPEQDILAAEYEKLVKAAFDQLPDNGKFYFQRAAEVLRKVADWMDN